MEINTAQDEQHQLRLATAALLIEMMQQDDEVHDKEYQAVMSALQEKFDWNARVFKERQDNIPLACEIPVEIEQRAFAVGRTIRFHMS